MALSLAAQAFQNAPDDAVKLKVIANMVLPDDPDYGARREVAQIEDDILAIATELRGQISPSRKALCLAGAMAEAGIALVGGTDLNGKCPAARIDDISVLSARLRETIEAYNDHMVAWTRGLTEGSFVGRTSPTD